VTVGGSWCPNCHDEAPFLVELYKEFHARGLEIVGLFFENDPDLSVVRPRVLSFISATPSRSRFWSSGRWIKRQPSFHNSRIWLSIRPRSSWDATVA